MAQRGTQATGWGVMMGRCSPDSQHGRISCPPANVGCSFFRYMNDNSRKYTNRRRKHKTWTREDNQLALSCYFRSNPTQRGYRKRMIEIWQECASIQTTSQRLVDHIWTIIKKGWFSDIEILEILMKIYNEQDNNTVPHTSSTNKQKQPNRNKLPTSENGNNPEQTLSQEQKVNLENLKGIMNGEKTTLPSLRNIEWTTFKTETNKIN